MELREAIEEVRKANTRYFSQASDLAKSVILEAIIDGTLIPANQTVKVDDDKLWQAMNDGYAHYEDFKRDVLSALIPADAVFQVREGYEVMAQQEFPESVDVLHTKTVPLSEALEIRSADDVRREGFSAGIEAAAERLEESMTIDGARKVIRALPPTDTTSTVAEAAKVICDAWDADTLPVNDPDPMLPSFIAALRALAAQKGEE